MKNSSLSPTITNDPFTSSICLQNARHFFTQFWRYAPEKDVLVQEKFNGGEDIERIVFPQDLSYISEII